MQEIIDTIESSLGQLDLGGMYLIREKVNTIIDNRKEESMASFRQRYQTLLTEARQLGISLKPEVAPAVPRYRDPTDFTKTWAGRGKKPAWLADLLAAGATLESLAIEQPAE